MELSVIGLAVGCRAAWNGGGRAQLLQGAWKPWSLTEPVSLHCHSLYHWTYQGTLTCSSDDTDSSLSCLLVTQTSLPHAHLFLWLKFSVSFWSTDNLAAPAVYWRTPLGRGRCISLVGKDTPRHSRLPLGCTITSLSGVCSLLDGVQGPSYLPLGHGPKGALGKFSQSKKEFFRKSESKARRSKTNERIFTFQIKSYS